MTCEFRYGWTFQFLLNLMFPEYRKVLVRLIFFLWKSLRPGQTQTAFEENRRGISKHVTCKWLYEADLFSQILCNVLAGTHENFVAQWSRWKWETSLNVSPQCLKWLLFDEVLGLSIIAMQRNFIGPISKWRFILPAYFISQLLNQRSFASLDIEPSDQALHVICFWTHFNQLMDFALGWQMLWGRGWLMRSTSLQKAST